MGLSASDPEESPPGREDAPARWPGGGAGAYARESTSDGPEEQPWVPVLLSGLEGRPGRFKSFLRLLPASSTNLPNTQVVLAATECDMNRQSIKGVADPAAQVRVSQITAWEDLTFFHEEVDQTGKFRHTTFAAVDKDDTAYFGKSNHPKRNLTFRHITFALTPISDNDLFPEWAPCNAELTQAPDTLPPNTYIKRPNLSLYDTFQEHNVLDNIPKGLLEEAKAMEMISKHPHPNVIYYHGCRVRRGHITGLVLDRHPHTLTD
ncbi:serine/threonine protein kinase [Zalerion maritima]|uniref:Serine/threonine protein kinase n=1 Tax=Zalerion maritima TaxID=339359 RepID=A0AAD5RKU5_9PEZI|nr:serine/threonine protein kinase [Zalerion maritima]